MSEFTASAASSADGLASDTEELPVALALARVQQRCGLGLGRLATEQLALRDALGRVLAQDLISPIDVPSHDNSAMDGFAFDGRCLQTGAERVGLTVVGQALAGHAFAGHCSSGACVGVMTGAVMPSGCDTVVPLELTRSEGGMVEFSTHAVRRGDNRRLAGEDLARGQAALRAGRIIRPADLGLVASLGVAELPVKRRLRVAFFSTGDELRSLGQALDAGCVYDSNRYTLYGMLKRLGVDVLDMGVIADRPEALQQALRQAAASADAIVTSGGVSVGAADYTKHVMAQLGDVGFWKIAMRPGRPMAFGGIASDARLGGGEVLLFGLPGNPVAVMVTFYQFVRPGLLTLMGAVDEQPVRLTAISAERMVKRPERTEYRRGQLFVDPDGQTRVQSTGAQGSGILRSMSQANCLIVLDHDLSVVEPGQPVAVVPFDGLV